jgi:hypothetical protein
MTLNEMKLGRTSPCALFPPTIQGFFAFEGGLTISSNSSKRWVAKDGVEPPTPAFSGLDSLGLNPFSMNNLFRQGGPSFVTIL